MADDKTPGRVTSETVGRVRVLTIDNPTRSNALSLAMWETLIDEFARCDADPLIGAVVLTGSGERVFCAGGDLLEMGADDRAGKAFVPPAHRDGGNVYEVISGVGCPTIAAVNGSALGGGFELALACDIRLAVPGARVGLPEVRWGLGATFGSVALPRLAPVGIALEMLCTGEPITSERAAAIGLVNHVVIPSALRETALGLAARIAANAPLSVRRVKAMAAQSHGLPLTEALRLDAGPDPYASEDRKEGVRAFAEKRAPRWQGR